MVTYIVMDNSTAVLVDPFDTNLDSILSYLKDNELNPYASIETHPFKSCIKSIKEVYPHCIDTGYINKAKLIQSNITKDYMINDGERFSQDNLTLRIISSGGPSIANALYDINGELFGGNMFLKSTTEMPDCSGRTGSYNALWDNIQKISKYDNDNYLHLKEGKIRVSELVNNLEYVGIKNCENFVHAMKFRDKRRK